MQEWIILVSRWSCWATLKTYQDFLSGLRLITRVFLLYHKYRFEEKQWFMGTVESWVRSSITKNKKSLLQFAVNLNWYMHGLNSNHWKLSTEPQDIRAFFMVSVDIFLNTSFRTSRVWQYSQSFIHVINTLYSNS